MSKSSISVSKIKLFSYSNPFSSARPPLVTDFGESCTDKTTFRPDISLARAYQGAAVKNLLYDFDDGKDTGETVQTVLRSPGLDITEVDSAVARVTQIIEDKKDKSKLTAEEKKQRDEFIDKLSSSLKDSQDSPNTEQESTK